MCTPLPPKLPLKEAAPREPLELKYQESFGISTDFAAFPETYKHIKPKAPRAVIDFVGFFGML
jgi:hypothetical protein